MPTVQRMRARRPKMVEELHVEALLGEGCVDELFEGEYVVDRSVLADLVDGIGDCGGEGSGRDGCADDERERPRHPG